MLIKEHYNLYLDSKELTIIETESTPFVSFLENGEVLLRGRSVPDHGREFYIRIIDWLEDTMAVHHHQFVVRIDIDIFNAVSSVLLLHLLKKMRNHCDEMLVTWYSDSDQPYNLEFGMVISEFVDAQFSFFSSE